MTRVIYEDYLSDLERKYHKEKLHNFYLWPRTPLTPDHQEIIKKRVGASDLEANNSRSRPFLIISQIRNLIEAKLIPESFSILDIACGDALVLWQIKKTFPDSYCFGIDCNINKFDTHNIVKRDGVKLYNIFIQHLFRQDVDRKFDVVLMLNTYRGWESADLREHERNLPDQADCWFGKNAEYIIITATSSQIINIKELGFKIYKMGSGEDESLMICMSLNDLPKTTFFDRLKEWLR